MIDSLRSWPCSEGGRNYVHPVIQYNEAEERTQVEVLAFMEQTAAIEAKLNPAAAAGGGGGIMSLRGRK